MDADSKPFLSREDVEVTLDYYVQEPWIPLQSAGGNKTNSSVGGKRN